MCGIVGARHDWLVANGLEPATAMREAVRRLAWRGPDGQGAVQAGPWWLGCARLAITQPRSRQPLVRRGGRHAVVCNGAITNARELWARLLPGAEHRPAPPNDAWLPLLAVANGDLEALAQLRGHFAYAVVDAATGELTLGRDRFGEKPLFTLTRRIAGRLQVVAFASSPDALRCVGGSPPVVQRRLAHLLRFGWLPLRAPRGLATPSQLQAQRLQQALRAGDPPGDLRARLLASVRRCADTTVPAALSLSGGLDSSCLAVALAAVGRPLPAYQARAQGAPDHERAAAAAVAARTGLEFRPVDVGPEALDALPYLTRCAGLPLGDPSILAVHALARAAAADGVRVLLGGEGADELFFGYRRYTALARLPRLRWLRGIAPAWSMRPAARWLRAASDDDPIAALAAVAPPAFLDAVLTPELLPKPRRARRHDAVARDLAAEARTRDIAGYLRFDLLPKIDVACMAAGVEARAPYLEGDFAGRPTRASLGKKMLRAAFESDLPPAVLALPKTGFALPLDRWFRGDLPWLDLLAEPRTRQRPHLRPGGIAQVVDRHRRGSADLGHGLYLLVAVELFLRDGEENRPGREPGRADP
jgi:asparagine synthase (glutamine-hydrolysing)